MSERSEKKRIRSALYVDFDNVYGSLDNLRARAEGVFARRPEQWLDWLASGGHTGEDGTPRNILIRRVYINPKEFGSYRAHFTNAGFQTIDCPSLTRRGKNSADILMAMDIMDALRHDVHFDEFIILSADADFTPVLLRLREHDRETTILSTDITAQALRGAATNVLRDFEFVEKALGIADPYRSERVEAEAESAAIQQSRDPEEELAFVANLVKQHVRGAAEPVQISDLPHVVRDGYPPFMGSDWLGYRSLRKLVDAVVSVQPELRVREQGADVWLEMVDAPPDAMDTGAATEPPEPMDDATLRERILDYIERELANSPEPLHGAVLGLNIPKVFGSYVRDSNWLGAGTMSQLIRNGGRPNIMAVGHSIYDPSRHEAPSDATASVGASPLAGLSQPLADLIDDLNAVGWPRIKPAQVRLIISESVRSVSNGLAEPHPLPLSGAVRDAIRDGIDSGALSPDQFVSRANISMLLNCMLKADVNMAEACASESEMRRQLYQLALDLIAENIGPPDAEKTTLLDELLGYGNAGDDEGQTAPLAPPPPGPDTWQHSAPTASPPLPDPEDNTLELEHIAQPEPKPEPLPLPAGWQIQPTSEPEPEPQPEAAEPPPSVPDEQQAPPDWVPSFMRSRLSRTEESEPPKPERKVRAWWDRSRQE